MTPTEPYKILIVDDEPDVRECLKKYLERRYSVDIADAADGTSAVAKVREWGPDLMLLDIQMPGLSGWEVIREVRKFDSAVKIVIISGRETILDDEETLIAAHVAAFLHKPLIFEELVPKIFAILGGEPLEKQPARTIASSASGRPEARNIVHTLSNILSRIRMKSEYFVANYEAGYFKGQPDVELLEEAVKSLKAITADVDAAVPTVEEIRKL